MRFTPLTDQCLRAAGWFPGRQVDILPASRLLETDGYTIFPVAGAFIAEFNGLRINVLNRRGRKYELLELDAIVAAKGESKSKLQVAIPAVVGTQLCPVGEAYSGYTTLSIGADGRVFFSYDTFVHLAGATADQALDNICEDVDMKCILELKS